MRLQPSKQLAEAELPESEGRRKVSGPLQGRKLRLIQVFRPRYLDSDAAGKPRKAASVSTSLLAAYALAVAGCGSPQISETASNPGSPGSGAQLDTSQPFTALYPYHMDLGEHDLTVSYTANEVLTFSADGYYRLLLGSQHPASRANTKSLSRVGNTVAVSFRPSGYSSTYFVTFCDLASQQCRHFASKTPMGPGKLVSEELYVFSRPELGLSGLQAIPVPREHEAGPDFRGPSFGMLTVFDIGKQEERELKECGGDRTLVFAGLGPPHFASLDNLLFYKFYAAWRPGESLISQGGQDYGVSKWLSVSLEPEGPQDDRHLCIRSASVLDGEPSLSRPSAGRFLKRAGEGAGRVPGERATDALINVHGSILSLSRSPGTSELVIGFQEPGERVHYSVYEQIATINIDF